MKRVLRLFLAIGTYLFVFAGVASAVQVLTFSGTNAAGDCYADGQHLLEGECYAVIWQKSGIDFRGFNADGSLVDPETSAIFTVLSGARGAKHGNRSGVSYSYCPAYSSQVSATTLSKYAGYDLVLYALDTRCWASGVATLAELDANRRPCNINSYAKVMDLELQFDMGQTPPAPLEYFEPVSTTVSSVKSEKLVFRTVGNDCFVEGSVTSSLAKGECYALVWKRNASVSPEFTFASPEPAVTVTGTETYWFAGYYPVAQNDGTKAWCPDVTIEAGALPFALAKGGVWSVYLLNTRDPKRDGTTTCGFDPAVANKPNHIIAFAPVPGLTDFTLRVTDNPAVSADKTATAATVADRQTAKPQLEIVCNGNGGTPASQTISLAWGAKIGSGGLVPVTRTGYSLSGWAVTDTGRTVDASTPLHFNDPLEARWTANSYSVAFDANGGTGTMGPQNLQYDQSQALSPNRFARPGYGFAGWATSVSGPVVYSDGASVKNLTASSGGRVTLYAVWTAGVNTVTFDANGGATSEASKSVKTDAKVGTLPTATRLGYTFAGWFTARSGGDRVTADSIVRTSVTYYARWTANAYTVDFNERGGSGAMADQPMVWDEAAALYANQFTRVGYTFLGWTDDEDELCEVLFYDGFVVSNLTDVAGGEYDLYAVWAANTYQVTFDANGGTGTMGPQDFQYDQEQALTSCKFVREGFGFLGWATAGSDEVRYRDGEKVLNLTAEPGGEIALKAIWLAGASTVSFDACGGDASEVSRCVMSGDKLGKLPTVTWQGYEFLGWFTAREGGEKVAEDFVVKAYVTCYAQWKANTYVVRFDGRGGRGAMTDQKMTWEKSDALHPNGFVRSGYAFLGWTDDVSELEEVRFADGAVVSNLTAVAGGTVTLFAIWEAKDNVVMFDACGGTVDEASRPVKTDATVGSLPTATRQGYAFAGWFTARTGGDRVTADTIVKAPVNYYAHWVANSYVVEFNANGGRGTMSSVSMTYDQSRNLPPCNFERSGYAFLGWARASSGAVAFSDKASVLNLVTEGTVKLFAVWERAGLWEPVFDEHGVRVGPALDASAAATFNAYACDANGQVVGTLNIKVAAAKGKKGQTVKTSQVTVTVQLLDQKKETVKGTMIASGDEADRDGVFTGKTKSGQLVVLNFGVHGVSGKIGGYFVDGAINGFVAKDKSLKDEAAKALAKRQGAYAVVFGDETGWNTLSIAVGAKGKTKVSGALVDGSKVSVTSQLLIGADGVCAVPVSYTKKNVSFAFVLWLSDEGCMIAGFEGAKVGKIGASAGEKTFGVDKTALSGLIGDDTYDMCYPDGISVELVGKKLVIAHGAKAGKVVLNKDKTDIDWAKAGENPSALKLTYTSKTGEFKGSFKAYVKANGKPKAVTVTVSGLMLDGVGYGTALVKKSGSVAVEIR